MAEVLAVVPPPPPVAVVPPPPPLVPPPPPASRVAIYDTECFPQYWLLKLRPIGGVCHTFRLRSGERFDVADVGRIQALFQSYTTVSFNGNGYDKWMIGAALQGYTPEDLKCLNDRIIVERVKPWELGIPEWAPADHIDVMEVAPGQGSQKQYAGRIHCKTMRDLPYEPDRVLTEPEIVEVEAYCENDLDVLEALYTALLPQIHLREKLSQRYGMDLRSKSDAQLAEAVLRKRCEQALGRRIYKPDVDWNLCFRYRVPDFIRYDMPQLRHALDLVRESVFSLGASGSVTMPPQLEGLCVTIGASTYKMGIGGLHSQESVLAVVSDHWHVLRMPDVASYYPTLILNSGEYPPALGEAFAREYGAIKDERLAAKSTQGRLKKAGATDTLEYEEAKVGNEGGKIMINGTFGKTGSPYSVLFAPTMLIQTTITGQLSLLMLIEWHEIAGIPVVSANTDGIVIKCPRHMTCVSEAIIKLWEHRTGLEMETEDYLAIYARDVNNYFAIKSPDDVKRKGEYATAGLTEKKNPDCEICADAAAEFLARGTPVTQTIRECRDIRKFVAIQRVSGGGVKMWGEGPRKDAKVSDMTDTLLAHGWVKDGRKWARAGVVTDARSAYTQCFAPQRPEYLGKVIRWYYGTNAPGPILYASNGNTVSLSYGAQPCMTLPDSLPDDIDYAWYERKALSMLDDVGYVR